MGCKRDFKFGEGIGHNLQVSATSDDNGKIKMGALNILLVDDDRNLVTTLSYGLRKAMGKAISVAVCFSDSEALSKLATQRFDVVISDFNMPGASGLEFLNKLRQDHREMILVLITAYGTDTLEEEVHRLGIGYIAKPFEPAHLVQILHDLIRSAETAKTRDGTENAPRILISDPEGNTDLGRVMGKVFTDPEVPN
jgi:DNA-binding NtrC family response regulator